MNIILSQNKAPRKETGMLVIRKPKSYRAGRGCKMVTFLNAPILLVTLLTEKT